MIRRLNEDDEIAFVAGDGPQRWKAVSTVENLANGRYALWQHTGDPLLLTPPAPAWDHTLIADPWAGWKEERTGADPTLPFFGQGDSSVFYLDWYPTPMQDPPVLRLTSFGWIGSRYQKAPPATLRCWNRLKGWIKRSAEGLTDIRTTFWAFPSALEKLRGGMPYYANGFDLSGPLGLTKP